MAASDPVPQHAISKPRKPRGRFELQEELGTGGMGTVYRAFDRELNRTVAVKVLRPELVPDLANLLRLKRELVLASRVSDEHVVRVHDIGQIDGRALISMDWVDGETLAQLLQRVHTLPPSQVFTFANQVAQALRAIHAANVVHRDLKPGNLLIRSDGAMLVSDFGLARSALPQDVPLTQPGDLGGTPNYMAPEQLAGLPADARSDLYSFGVILLEMLTATTALETLDPLRLRILAVATDKHLRAAESRCLSALEPVIRRCLCYDRAERYASADLVLADLATAHMGAPAPAAIRWSLRAAARSRFGKITVVLIVLLLTAFGFSAWRHYYAARLAQTERLYAQAMSSISAQSSEGELRQAVGKLNQVVARQPAHAAAIRARIDTLIRLYERTENQEWLDKARDALANAPPSGLSAGEGTLLRARIDLDSGSFQNVIDALLAATALRAGSEPANRLLGRALAASNQVDVAIQYYTAAIRLNPESWLAHNDLGVALVSLGRLKEARREFALVTELQPQSPVGYENLGSALFDAGQFSEARNNFEIGLQLAPSAGTYYNLGLVSFYSREYAISIPFFEKAIAMSPGSDIYLAGLADSLRHLHQMDRARDSYARALSLLEQAAAKRALSVEEQSRRAIGLARLGDRDAANSVLNALSSNLDNKNLSYARGVVAMLDGRVRAANQHLKDAERYGCPPSLIDLNPDFDDLVP